MLDLMRWLNYNPTLLFLLASHPSLPNGGGGGDTGGGGGIPGTPTGTSQPASGLPVGENGGISAPSDNILLIPVQDSVSSRCYLGYYDVTNFNDNNDGSYYKFRKEDVVPLRVPTVRRIGVVYRDLGTVKVTFSLSAVNDNGNVITSSQKVTLGTSGASNDLLTAFVDVVITGFRPQLTVTRGAGDGPLSIVSITLIGEVEESTL
jgi:hypothetical protein